MQRQLETAVTAMQVQLVTVVSCYNHIYSHLSICCHLGHLLPSGHEGICCHLGIRCHLLASATTLLPPGHLHHSQGHISSTVRDNIALQPLFPINKGGFGHFCWVPNHLLRSHKKLGFCRVEMTSMTSARLWSWSLTSGHGR